MSIFMVKSLMAPVDLTELSESYLKVIAKFKDWGPESVDDVEKCLTKYRYPHGQRLTKDADVGTVEQLFSRAQLADLAVLRTAIMEEENPNIRDTLMLMFSGLLTKANRTYHTSSTKPRAGQETPDHFAIIDTELRRNPSRSIYFTILNLGTSAS